MRMSTAGPVIRSARPADLDSIADLQARSIMALGRGTYGQEACEAWARMGRQMRHGLLKSGTFFVAEQDVSLIGVAGWVEDSRQVDCAWARYVFVAPEASGLGVGRLLMTRVERSTVAADRTRVCLWASLNAVGFYRALGYKELEHVRWPITGTIEMEHALMEKAMPAEPDRHPHQ